MNQERNLQNGNRLEQIDRTRMVRYAARIVGPEEAEDVVQMALLKAHKRIDSFHGESQLQTWFVAILRNCARDLLRLRRRRPEQSIPETLELAYTPESDIRLISENNIARRCLQQLPPNYREALIASAAFDSGPEAAAALGIKNPTLKSRRYRAKQRLEALVHAAGA